MLVAFLFVFFLLWLFVHVFRRAAKELMNQGKLVEAEECLHLAVKKQRSAATLTNLGKEDHDVGDVGVFSISCNGASCLWEDISKKRKTKICIFQVTGSSK